MAEDKIQFQADVTKLLDIVVHSLYSNKEIFLRELISNASDACDRLRYLSLTNPDVVVDGDFQIGISIAKKARTVTVTDNGIGMSRDELVDNLGTIAKSGTTAFLESLTGDEQKDAALIGQFGVGFYSSFSVARQVEVLTRKAGDDAAWLWSSEGGGEFTIADAERESAGTTVTVHLAKGESEYLEAARLRQIVKTYSDHIPIAIRLTGKDGDEQINAGSALWTRPAKDITEDQYREFYHHVGHVFDDPWLTLRNRAEGKIEYTNLLFIPSSRPFDLMNPERKHSVKLYVKKVFITDDCEELMPGYLRFVRGIVDSEDLPLNVSREMLQRNPVVARIRSALVRRIFAALKKKAEKAPDEYAVFWQNFGAVLKEGLYEDTANKDKLLEIVKFSSTGADGLITLADYAGRMKEGQDELFYITGDDLEALRASPQLEGFAARGIEVLLLVDPIDEFWVPAAGLVDGNAFVSITSAAVDLGKFEKDGDSEDQDGKKEDNADAAGLALLIVSFKQTLGDLVKDVRSSDRLTDSAVCLVAGEGDMDLHLELMLKAQGHLGIETSPRILEVNPAHPLIKRLADLAEDGENNTMLADSAHLLLDQARIMEGDKISDPAAFSERLNKLLVKGLGA